MSARTQNNAGPDRAKPASPGEVAGAPEVSNERALRFVLPLYELGRVLAEFESVERTFPAVIAVVAQALPLHTVIFLGSSGGRPSAFVWQAAGRGAPSHAEAKA